MKRAVIVGSGSEIAPVKLTNDQMARILDTSDAWIRERSGVEERHFASPEVATSDLGTAAARKALERAGIETGAVDMVVFATMTPDGAELMVRVPVESVGTWLSSDPDVFFAYGKWTTNQGALGVRLRKVERALV